MIGVLFFIWRVFEFAFFSFVHGSVLVARVLRRLLLRGGPTLLESVGLYLTGLFESLGATFVKIGQVASSRPDLFPGAITNPLKRLQDQVAPFNTARIPAIVEGSFGRRMDEVFASFEMKPVSAASVAHVHRAVLKDGRTVAVKVRRPGLLRRVKYDLLVLKFFTKILNAVVPDMHLVSLPEMVDEFGQNIYRQLDFKLEAENNRTFRKNFAGQEHIKFPDLVDELCTDEILVMEFIEGLERLDELDLTKEERQIAARAALKALYQMIFADAFIHGDMHPGNIFFRKNGDFVLLDLGLVARLTPIDQKNFLDFFFGMVTNNGKMCADVIFDTAPFRRKSADRGSFTKEVVALIAEHANMAAADFEVSGFSAKLFDCQRRHGIANAPAFSTSIVAIIVFEGITKFLDPDLDFQAEGRKYFAEALGRKASRPQG